MQEPAALDSWKPLPIHSLAALGRAAGSAIVASTRHSSTNKAAAKAMTQSATRTRKPTKESTLRQKVLRRAIGALALVTVCGCVPSITQSDYQQFQATWAAWLIVLKAFGFLLAIAAVLVIWGLMRSRWTLVVFVTFHHGRKAWLDKIVQCLETSRIQVLYLRFEPREHDSVLQEVARNLRQCDLVISIPGDEKSFVDAEILAATSLQKPVIFIKDPTLQDLPDTALSGYPVFSAECLEQRQWVPLVRFCQYAGRHWRETYRAIQRTAVECQETFAWISAGLFVPLFLGDLLEPIFIWFFGAGRVARVEMYLKDLPLAVLFLVIALVRIILTISRQKSALRAVRQTLLSGDLTFPILEASLGTLKADRAVVDCLLKQPLQPRTRNAAA